MKKADEFKEVKDSLTKKQLSFFLKLNLDKSRSVKAIGQEFYTADTYVYNVLYKLAKLNLIEVEKGVKELIITTTDFGIRFIKEGDFQLLTKQ